MFVVGLVCYFEVYFVGYGGYGVWVVFGDYYGLYVLGVEVVEGFGGVWVYVFVECYDGDWDVFGG